MSGIDYPESDGLPMAEYDPVTGRSLLSHLETEQARLAEQEARLAEQGRSQKLAAKLRELGIDPETL